MHDIWNPWHGCKKCSEGCQNCYMYYLDQKHNHKESFSVYKTSNFYYPLSKDRKGNYKVKSGELLRVCMTSDFFVEEADVWRSEAWNIIYNRPDVKFFLLTKRPERVKYCLPSDWKEGWENVFFNVTAENQSRADERIPFLLDLPFRHKGIMIAPLLGEMSIEKYLKTGQIEQVICGGENYDGARPCHYEWVEKLSRECEKYNITFAFIETGNYYIKQGRVYVEYNKRKQAQIAYQESLWHRGKPIRFLLTDRMGLPIPKEDLYVPHYRTNCLTCGNRLICNGCSDCGKCTNRIVSATEIVAFEKKKL